LLAGTIATAVLNDPFLDEQPGGLRELQEDLGHELMDDAADALKDSHKAADKVMNMASTKVGSAPCDECTHSRLVALKCSSRCVRRSPLVQLCSKATALAVCLPAVFSSAALLSVLNMACR
jgi:hypothetical protein